MEERKRAIYQSYNPHDCEAFYKCPYCDKVFGSWSIFHQKSNREETHCPYCDKPLIVGD
jgi:uncharacterized Zn-finger protein